MKYKGANYRLVLPVLLLGVALLFPLGYIIQTSLQYQGHFGINNYVDVVKSGVYSAVFRNTAIIAAVVVLITLCVGYCVAVLLRVASPGVKIVLVAALVYPFFTSVLVKSFSFIIILGPAGPLSQLAKLMGLGQFSLMYSWTAVIIGMSYSLLPYMTLTLYASVRGVDDQVLLAARNLGASRIRALFGVLIPMTKTGIIGGSLLVFVLSFGYYVTPALLGGPGDSMVAMSIATQALTALNFGMACALALGVVVAVGLVFVLYMRLVGVDALIQGEQL